VVEKSSGDEYLLEVIRKKERKIDSLNHRIADLNKINEELASDLINLEYETSHSIIWNIYKKFNTRFIVKLFPSGTRRERIGHHFRIALEKTLKSEKREPDQALTGTPEGVPLHMKNEEEHLANYYRAFFQSILQNATIESPFYEKMKKFVQQPSK